MSTRGRLSIHSSTSSSFHPIERLSGLPSFTGTGKSPLRTRRHIVALESPVTSKTSGVLMIFSKLRSDDSGAIWRAGDSLPVRGTFILIVEKASQKRPLWSISSSGDRLQLAPGGFPFQNVRLHIIPRVVVSSCRRCASDLPFSCVRESEQASRLLSAGVSTLSQLTSRLPE